MKLPMQPTGTVCQRCGACCAAFRVSFYWTEALQLQLPDSLVERASAHLACLLGTNATQPHCAALRGVVGVEVSCGVYAQRPSPCREVEIGDEKCTRARAVYGLPPLASPEADRAV